MKFPTFEKYLDTLKDGWVGEFPDVLLTVAKKSYEAVKNDWQVAWDKLKNEKVEDEDSYPGCSKDCEEEEGCIKCNPFAFSVPVKQTTYYVTLPVKEFRKYLVEGDKGPWGDTFFDTTFGKFIEGKMIQIEYKYGDYDGKSEIKWRIPDTHKIYSCKYTGSSAFAMWWCGLTDEVEDCDDHKNEDCCGCIYHGDDGCKCGCHSVDDDEIEDSD